MVPRAVLDAYAGTYSSPVAPITIAVREDGMLTLKFGGQPATPLRAISESEFAAIGVDAKVVFRKAGETVTGLVISSGRELPRLGQRRGGAITLDRPSRAQDEGERSSHLRRPARSAPAGGRRAEK